MTTRFWLAAACALTLATGTACNRDTADDTAAGTGTATTTASELRVDEIRLGNAIGADNRVATESDDFATNETIYASIRTAGTAPNATLVARWTFEDGQVVSEDTRTIAPNGSDVTEFHITNPNGWPAGDYKLEVMLNGQSVGSKDFEVK